MTLTVLDLFSGIGGFSYGFERTGGFRTVAFCERDAYATRVLGKHWPEIPVFPDVCEVGAASLAAAGVGRIDVVCGGFPCQDISLAGKGAGLAGERSGLWFEMLRIIDETRPAFVVAENVSALRSRGLEDCLGGLASIGYDAEWHCIPAAAVGAPHRRDRVWIVAHAKRAGLERASGIGLSIEGRAPGVFANMDETTLRQRSAETVVYRGDDGVPCRVDRMRAIGNSIVPQIAEMIGRAILLDQRVA